MDQLQLFQLLRNETEERDIQIKTLEKALSGLLTNLSTALPDKSEIFTQLATEMSNTLNQINQRNVTVPLYFSGNGPGAKKLREHMLITQWYADRLPAQSTGALKQEISFFLECLAMFDFKPLTDAESCNEVNNFLTQCVKRVRTGYFSSPLPALPSNVASLDELQTGIFGNPGTGMSQTLILRIGKADVRAFQAIFIAIPDKNPSMWYFHPWEATWMNPHQWDVTFTGMRRRFEEEFEIALRRALGEDQHVDWEAEITDLNETANAIFDKEELLPQLVKLPPNGETAYLSYDNVRSEIYVNVGGVMMVFINTRGAFPQRTGARLMTTLDGINGLCSVDEEKVPDELRLGLIYKARVVLASLKTQVDVAIAENRPAKPRADPIQPTDGYLPGVLN
jgi:hypothetical protein